MTTKIRIDVNPVAYIRVEEIKKGFVTLEVFKRKDLGPEVVKLSVGSSLTIDYDYSLEY